MDNNLKLLEDSVQKAQDRVKKDPSEKHLRALEKASRMLEAAKNKGERTYPNAAEALRELQRRGYKIKKSKFYGHVKAGYVELESDGSILESSLKKYLKHPRANLFPAVNVPAGEDTHKKKLEMEVDRLSEQVRILRAQRQKQEGSMIDKNQFYLEYAGMTECIYQHLRNHYYMKAGAWVEMILKHGPDSSSLFLKALKQGLDDTFNELAAIDKFTVRFIADTEEGDATGKSEVNEEKGPDNS